MTEPADRLLAEEQHVLVLMAAGSSAAEAADDLGLSIVDVARCLPWRPTR